MSHVDEGALHAYLDGALDEYPAAEARRVREHVETCAVCAERLADERRVRDDARAILDLAAPKVAIPTFEELRAYVRAGESKRAAAGRLYKMGWAASVVLALGTGWLLRGGPIDPATGTFRAESGAPAPAPERAAVETATAAGQDAPEEIERDAAVEVPPSAPVPTEPAPAAAFERALADPAGVPPAAGRAVVTQAPAPQATGPAPDAAADQLAAAARAPDDAPADTPVGGAAAFGGAAASLDSSPQLSAARIQERIDSAARAAESRRRVSSDRAVTSALDAAAPASPPAMQRARAANEVQRDEDEDSGSLVVPGLEVLDVLPVSEGTAFAGVRNLQRLENGDTLEVIHLPEGIDPSLLPPLTPGKSELVRPTPEGWLVMRARVTQAYLQQLLERLEAVR